MTKSVRDTKHLDRLMRAFSRFYLRRESVNGDVSPCALLLFADGTTDVIDCRRASYAAAIANLRSLLDHTVQCSEHQVLEAVVLVYPAMWRDGQLAPAWFGTRAAREPWETLAIVGESRLYRRSLAMSRHPRRRYRSVPPQQDTVLMPPSALLN